MPFGVHGAGPAPSGCRGWPSDSTDRHPHFRSPLVGLKDYLRGLVPRLAGVEILSDDLTREQDFISISS